MSLKAEEKQALAAFRAWLNEHFGPRVRRVRLFGSLARGERHEESDVDVAVEIDGLLYLGFGDLRGSIVLVWAN